MILLVQLERGMDRLFQPLGLLYVADALEKQGKPVEIFHDHGTEENVNTLLDMVEEEEPEWVGLHAATTPSLISIIDASKRIKAETGSKVVWGGPHPTIIDGVEEEWYVDEAIRGEGETWVSGRPMTNLDEYQPTWHLIDPNRYGDKLYLVTSRGCPHRCGFCYNPAVWERMWKCHSVEKTIEIFSSYPGNPEEVFFRDDYFFTDKERAVEIVNRLGTPWSATIRAADLKPELLRRFKVKPSMLSFGIESGSQRLLNLIRKDQSLVDVFDALQAAEEFEIPLYCSFVSGLPTETPGEREATLRLAEKIERDYDVVCDVKPYRAYPKTFLYGLAVKQGFKPPTTTEEWAEYSIKTWDRD